jgi:hypothetical protein
VKRNPTTGSLKTRNHKAVRPLKAKQKSEASEIAAGSMETGRKYRVQVIVTDPEGLEVLNLTKLAFEDELQNIGYPTSDLGEVLQLLVEAAGEWSA